MVTWNRPSSSRASGATIMPPPKYFPLATTSVVTARSSSGASSKETRMRTSRQPASARSEAILKVIFPPSRLLERLAISTTLAPIPTSPTLMKYRLAALPARQVRRVHRALGEDMVDIAHRATHRLHDAVEMPRGRSVPGARIDDQEGFQRVPCASQRARTETTSVAPRAEAQAGLEVTAGPPSSAR